MSRRNLFQAFTATIALVLLIAAPANGDDSSPASVPNKPVEFQVSLRSGEIVGSEQIQRALLSVGTNQLLTVLPRGLRMESSASDKIVIVPRDYGYFLTLRILDASATASSQTVSEHFKNLLRERYPGALIQDESSIMVCNRTGTVFDLQWKTAGTVTRNVRVAFVPSSLGLLEVSVITDAQKSGDATYNFNVFVSSFRSNESGPISITLFSDAS